MKDIVRKKWRLFVKNGAEDLPVKNKVVLLRHLDGLLALVVGTTLQE